MQVHCIAVLRLSPVSVAQHGCCANTLKGALVPGTKSRRDDLIGHTKGVPTQVGFPMQCLPVLSVNCDS